MIQMASQFVLLPPQHQGTGLTPPKWPVIKGSEQPWKSHRGQGRAISLLLWPCFQGGGNRGGMLLYVTTTLFWKCVSLWRKMHLLAKVPAVLNYATKIWYNFHFLILPLKEPYLTQWSCLQDQKVSCFLFIYIFPKMLQCLREMSVDKERDWGKRQEDGNGRGGRERKVKERKKQNLASA